MKKFFRFIVVIVSSFKVTKNSCFLKLFDGFIMIFLNFFHKKQIIKSYQ